MQLPNLFNRHKYNVATVAHNWKAWMNSSKCNRHSLICHHSTAATTFLSFYQNHSSQLVITSFLSFQINLNNLNNQFFFFVGLGRLKGTRALLTGVSFWGNQSFYAYGIRIVVMEAKFLKQYGFVLSKEKLPASTFESSLPTAETNVKPPPTKGLIISYLFF